MKAIILAPLPPPRGGIAGWAVRMTQVHLKNGWQVKIVDEKVTGNRDAYSTKRNYYSEYKRCRRIWKDLRNALTEDSTIVQACIPAGTFSMLREIVSAIIARKAGAKFITHFRCTVPNMVRSKPGRIVLKILLNLSDCVFVLNKPSAEFINSIMPNFNCKIIPNFVEISTIEKRSYKNELKKIVYVGGVIPEKGCDRIADIAKELPFKEFRLIGKPDMDISIFPNNVTILGEQPKEVVQYELRRADAFLFLSRYIGEGFSNSLAEAMAFSLPCIVSDWAANRDMIEDKGGIVLKNSTIEEAVAAIMAIENKETRIKMGEWNRKKVIEKYSDKIVTDMYVNAYEELIGQ